ncbi:MAG: 5'-nucleotidase C-terminal domain-containing protein [Bacteroidota bacterium]|jgi:2',3'-cyclic-nucleotide 2'-phosphodiesterase (5'-nucleotidase family)|nr:5'-nucleotidase C-terminal domain-containing protein [Sphingobacteriales bacterium]
MLKFRRLFLYLGLSFVFAACHSSFEISKHRVSYNRIKADSLEADSQMLRLIAPYKQKLDAQMNEVIALTTNTLLRTQPEGTLNNLMAEAMLWYVTTQTEFKPDMAMMNYGGVRLPQISAGNITVGKVYELMPFDNLLEVLEIKGADIDLLCNHIAANGGWPLSGMRFTIRDGKANNLTINGAAIESEKTYLLVTSDYVANGGDKADMLKRAVKRHPINYTVRDAILEYLKNKQTIQLEKDGRISVD